MRIRQVILYCLGEDVMGVAKWGPISGFRLGICGVVERDDRVVPGGWRFPSPSSLIVACSDHDAMDDEQRRQDDWAKDRKNRLPTFTEVLSRRTRPPVDLFMF